MTRVGSQRHSKKKPRHGIIVYHQVRHDSFVSIAFHAYISNFTHQVHRETVDTLSEVTLPYDISKFLKEIIHYNVK
jgi:hypothetical protein